MHSLSGSQSEAFPWVPDNRVILPVRSVLVLKSSTSSAHYRQVLGGTVLALSEPVVPQCVWVSSMKLPEFLQTTY